MKRLVFFAIFALTVIRVCAQQVSVESKIDSMTILIGQQARMTVNVTAHHGAKVVFPQFKRAQYLVPGVEVLGASVADTSDIDGMTRVSKTYTLTSFDEHLYAIPGMKVNVDGKDYSSNQLALKVLTCDVDTLHPEQFFPPKDVQDNPFLWNEWSGLFWLGIAVMLLTLAFGYLLLRLKLNKPIITRVHVVKRIPAHQKALDEMNRLKAEHFETSDEQKLYYTKLTDTLRRYIRERFGFNAMEMTSSEIMEHLHSTGDDTMINELRELFSTADLVKFAKYSSLLNEKDMNLVNAINFIDHTKRDEVPTEEKIVPKLSDDEIKTRQNRVTIKAFMWGCAVVIVAMLAYIIYNVCQLMQ